jgi:hypothetical protein
MITTDAIRRLLAVADVARDPYAVATAAGSLLAADPRDAAAAGHYLRALAALKLTAAARRVAAAAGVAAAALPAPAGQIPWASRARRFAANLQALATNPAGGADAAARVRAAWEGGAHGRYELHQAGDGNFQILDTAAGGAAPHWLGGLADHRGAAHALWQFDKSATPVPHPIAFDGLGFGWLFTRAFETTAHSYLSYSCALYVLERDPVALAMLCHMHDLQAFLAAPRVRLFVDAGDPLRAFSDAIRRTPTWSIPERFVRTALLPGDPLPLEQAITQLRAEREGRRQALQGEIQSYYAGKGRAAWHRRFEEAFGSASAAPLRVLGITSRYTTVLQHSMAELKAAVEATGRTADPATAGPRCEMEIALESDDHSLEHPFLEMIAAFKPDLFVQLSRLRYENAALPQNVPFLCWDQDNLSPMRTAAATASVADPAGLTFVAGHGAVHGFTYLGWPARSVIPCHLAAATHRYAARAVDAADLARYACDFSYVSNAADPPGALRDAHGGRFTGPYADLFRALADTVMSPAGPDGHPWHDGTVRAAARRLAADRGAALAAATENELVMSCLLVADRALRHETLGWVSDLCRERGLTLRLYGHGWDRHPTLAAHAAGPAAPGDELAALTRASRINLQIIGTGALHPRLLDGLAAGGFFLYRQTYHDHADRPFLEARDVVSRHLSAHPAATFAELDAVGDAAVRHAWQRIRPTYAADDQFPEAVHLRGLAAARHLPHPLTAMPSLEEIGFNSPASFRTRADAFLNDDGHRAAVAGRLRTELLRGFSYDARWHAFLTHIRQALAAG